MDPSPKQRFRTNFLGFLDFFKAVVEDATKSGFNRDGIFIVELVKSFIVNLDDETIIDSFIDRSRSQWDKIIQRDSKYMVEIAEDIFSGVPVDKIKLFKDLFIKNFVSESDMDLFWQYYQTFVIISLKHLKEKGEDVDDQLKKFK